MVKKVQEKCKKNVIASSHYGKKSKKNTTKKDKLHHENERVRYCTIEKQNKNRVKKKAKERETVIKKALYNKAFLRISE